MKYKFLITILFALLVGILLFLAPLEKSLGSTMRYVYLHVSLIWTGSLAIVTGGLLGLSGSLLNRNEITKRSQSLGWIALGLYSAGILVSGLAAWYSWGRIQWSEPIYAVSGRIMLVVIMIQVLAILLPQYRWSGLLYLIPVAYLIKATANIRMVMHPVDPIGNSGSIQIKLTFYVLTLLFAIWAGLMIWLSGRKP
ncbi:MAG: hypothetical protein H8E14_04685 [Candidatus Marinimicrobia bacterium]|nr:hypothetical protein [Candidatus Neomarinimicrobiota bacterium]